ncbi:MAG: sugar phosphate isomerase/epimerase [Candidatus Pacearchaeota archaeon]
MSSYESIYQGADFIMPKYNPTGYYSEIKSLGMSTDPRTANQLKEINIKLNPGMKHLEISGISSAVFESIPEQHLEEIRRLGEITGVTTSVHAPIVEPSGIGERGWEETNRLAAEKEIESVLSRSVQLATKKSKNVSVTVHTTAQLPELENKIKVYNPETKKLEEKKTNLWVINPESGRYTLIQPEKRFFPEEGEGKFKPEIKEKVFDPYKELEKINKDQWSEQLSNVNRFANYGGEILERVKDKYKLDKDLFTYIAKGEDIDKIKKDVDKEIIKDAQRDIIHGQIYLRDSYRHMRDLFDRAWARASDQDKEKLRAFAEKYAKEITPGFETDPEKIPVMKNMIDEGLKVLRNIHNPNTWVPLQDFVISKSAETFGNVAARAWEKFQDKTPILNIENPPAGSGLSRGEDVKKVVEESRKVMVSKLVEKGINKETAEEIAKKTIGATWDVGHINMLRKKGYTEEDIIKETEKIAPYVKHVHLSDNFGLEHTELPMGMGNVPLKEMMKKLGEKGFEGKKIIEAGNWWQYFAEQGGGNPFKPTIQAFDSPIYSMKEGYSWSQSDIYAGYYSGHGPINPPIHHNFYGAGFASLPVELGGEIPGQQSRFAGTPNQ